MLVESCNRSCYIFPEYIDEFEGSSSQIKFFVSSIEQKKEEENIMIMCVVVKLVKGLTVTSRKSSFSVFQGMEKNK